MKLHGFRGGLRLPSRKTWRGPIRHCPLPERLLLPLQQHGAVPLRAVVSVGQTVSARQMLAQADAEASAAAACLRAPCAAEVIAIEDRALVSNPALRGACIVLRRLPESMAAVDADPADLPAIADWQTRPRAQLLQRLHDAGVLGLGGAAFPTAAKLASHRHTLILNAAECEPYIACDDALLRERAAAVIAGAGLLAHIVDAERIVLAIEDDMPEAIEACRHAIEHANLNPSIELAIVPSLYPEGGERQLIATVTGREVPRGGLPRDLGVIVHNVATAAAAWAAVVHGSVMRTRLVSVAGAGVREPGTYEVTLGTPIADLVAAAGGYSDQAARLIIGGPMMGVALPHDDFPITAAANCVLVASSAELGSAPTEMPCIRCGECSRVCPAGLMPQQLLSFARAERWDRLQDHGVFDCIECAACDLACPSAIPLTEQFRWGKSALRQHVLQAARAEAAKARHQQRQQRMQDDAAQRAERRQQTAAPKALAAALARAKARAASKDEDA